MTTPLPYVAAASPFVASWPSGVLRTAVVVAGTWMAVSAGRMIYRRHFSGQVSVANPHWLLAVSSIVFMVVAIAQRPAGAAMFDVWTALLVAAIAACVLSLAQRIPVKMSADAPGS